MYTNIVKSTINVIPFIYMNRMDMFLRNRF